MSRHNFDAPNSYADDLPWNAGEDAWGFGAIEPEWLVNVIQRKE